MILRLCGDDGRCAGDGDLCGTGGRRKPAACGHDAAVLLAVSCLCDGHEQRGGIRALHAGIEPAVSGIILPLIGQDSAEREDLEFCGLADDAGIILRLCDDVRCGDGRDGDLCGLRGDRDLAGGRDDAAVLLPAARLGDRDAERRGLGAGHAGIRPAGARVILPLIGQCGARCGDGKPCRIADSARVIGRLCGDLRCGDRLLGQYDQAVGVGLCAFSPADREAPHGLVYRVFDIDACGTEPELVLRVAAFLEADPCNCSARVDLSDLSEHVIGLEPVVPLLQRVGSAAFEDVIGVLFRIPDCCRFGRHGGSAARNDAAVIPAVICGGNRNCEGSCFCACCGAVHPCVSGAVLPLIAAIRSGHADAEGCRAVRNVIAGVRLRSDDRLRRLCKEELKPIRIVFRSVSAGDGNPPRRRTVIRSHIKPFAVPVREVMLIRCAVIASVGQCAEFSAVDILVLSYIIGHVIRIRLQIGAFPEFVDHRRGRSCHTKRYRVRIDSAAVGGGHHAAVGLPVFRLCDRNTQNGSCCAALRAGLPFAACPDLPLIAGASADRGDPEGRCRTRRAEHILRLRKDRRLIRRRCRVLHLEPIRIFIGALAAVQAQTPRGSGILCGHPNSDGRFILIQGQVDVA